MLSESESSSWNPCSCFDPFSEQASQHWQVEQRGEDAVLQFVHGDKEGVKVVGVYSIQLMDSLLCPGQEAGRVDEGVEDMDACQEMLGQIVTGLGY